MPAFELPRLLSGIRHEFYFMMKLALIFDMK